MSSLPAIQASTQSNLYGDEFNDLTSSTSKSLVG